MRLFEITIPKMLYHGSPQPLKIGKAYRVRHWGSADQGGVRENVESIVEKNRPSNSIARNKAFYMVEENSQYMAVEKIEQSGGSTDYVYAVQPIGRVEKHDLQWLNDIDAVMTGEFPEKNDSEFPSSYSWHMTPIYNSEKAKTLVMLAQNYWAGKQYPYKSWTLWEYLSPSFKVLKLVYEGHE